MYQSILVPVDGSEYSLEALKTACLLAPGPEATIHLLNVPVVGPGYDEFGYFVGASAADDLRRQAERAGEEILRKTVQKLGEVDQSIEIHVDWGSPARVIVNLAEQLGVDAIVMGSRGLSDIKGLVMGSVSHTVMHIAECRVITVH